MAKFYLHMQPGETLGKVTKLKYIDDVSDDDLIIYVFEDNSKSDEEYIAELNNLDAFNGRYVMAEVSDPTNIWLFETKEFNLDVTRKVTDDMGNVFELPEPGISLSGEHISLSISDEGTIGTKHVSTAGKRTDSTPPRVVKNKKVEPKEDYLLSLHPELINGRNPNASGVNVSESIVPGMNTLVKQGNLPIQIGKVTNSPLYAPIPANSVSVFQQQKVALPQVSPISTNVIETVRLASININLDDIEKSTEYNTVNIVYNGKPVNMNIDEFIERLTTENISEPYVTENVIQESRSPFEDPSYKEDILITNMIDKSKKKTYVIGVDIELELPPKEVYKTIKEVYPDGMSLHFVTCIARRMDSLALKEALSTGLTTYYESSLNTETEK